MKKILCCLMLVSISISFVSCALHGSSGRQFGTYSEAEALYQKGKYEAAAGKYEQYLTETPQGALAAIASYYQAKCYGAIGKTDLAKAGYQKVIHEYPGTTWADFSKKQLENSTDVKKP